MTASERQAVTRAAFVLLLASILRFGHAHRSGNAVAPSDSLGVLPTLIAETERLIEEEEVRSSALAPGEKIDANRADALQIDRLPGIGPATADAWIRERDSGGPFSGPEDLRRVPGVGSATVARIESLLEFSGGTVRSGRFRSVPRTAAEERVDLNRATAEELERVPGIGPALAERILTLRGERGGYRTLDDLLEVSGIGEATLQRIRPHLRIR